MSTRLMRTYEVTLKAPGETAPVAATNLNLSYELNADHDAINGRGEVVDPASVQAMAEVAKRLRTLVAKGAVPISRDLLDDPQLDWTMNVVRSTLIKVPVRP